MLNRIAVRLGVRIGANDGHGMKQGYWKESDSFQRAIVRFCGRVQCQGLF